MGTFPLEVIAGAQGACKEYPAVPASVTLAQWALESAWGKSMPAGSFNPFGIKASSGQDYVACLTWEHIGGKDVKVTQRFRKFKNLTEAFTAHAKLLGTSAYYAKAREAATPQAFAKALNGVYATDPDYASKLISLMGDYDLDQYDLPAEAKTVAGATKPEVKSMATGATGAAPTAKKTSSVNVLAGLENFFGNIVGSMESATKAAVSTAVSQVQTGTIVAGSVGDIETAIAEVEAVIADIKAGKWQATAEDVLKLLTEVFSILSKFGVNIPGVTQAIAVATEVATAV